MRGGEIPADDNLSVLFDLDCPDEAVDAVEGRQLDIVTSRVEGSITGTVGIQTKKILLHSAGAETAQVAPDEDFTIGLNGGGMDLIYLNIARYLESRIDGTVRIETGDILTGDTVTVSNFVTTYLGGGFKLNFQRFAQG